MGLEKQVREKLILSYNCVSKRLGLQSAQRQTSMVELCKFHECVIRLIIKAEEPPSQTVGALLNPVLDGMQFKTWRYISMGIMISNEPHPETFNSPCFSLHPAAFLSNRMLDMFVAFCDTFHLHDRT